MEILKLHYSNVLSVFDLFTDIRHREALEKHASPGSSLQSTLFCSNREPRQNWKTLSESINLSNLDREDGINLPRSQYFNILPVIQQSVEETRPEKHMVFDLSKLKTKSWYIFYTIVGHRFFQSIFEEFDVFVRSESDGGYTQISGPNLGRRSRELCKPAPGPNNMLKK